MPVLWDPLTYENLMAGTVAHFDKQELFSLAGELSLEGPGIYALYYRGNLSDYKPIANTEWPIYVGKAVPPGTRKGGVGDTEKPALRNRLRDHVKSIREAKNLDPKEFKFRALAIVPVWIAFAEQALIKQYQPVWNSCLEGFGKHHQGENRRSTATSWWDTMHPGRPWAQLAPEARLPGGLRRTLPEAKELVRVHLATYAGN